MLEVREIIEGLVLKNCPLIFIFLPLSGQNANFLVALGTQKLAFLCREKVPGFDLLDGPKVRILGWRGRKIKG